MVGMAFTSKQIADLDTLRAIAHPLRMKLLAALRRDGPATASALGRALGESSGSTSYHLRQLERFGFIVEDDNQPSARERRWRAAHEMTNFSAPLWETDEGRELFDTVRRRQLEHLNAGLAARPEQVIGFDHSDYLLWLDEDDRRALSHEIDEVISGYKDRSGGEAVALHVLMLPGETT